MLELFFHPKYFKVLSYSEKKTRTFANFETFSASEVCSCEKKPQMVDKNLETDRELMLDFVGVENIDDSNFEISKHENVLIDLIEQKKAADLSEKVRNRRAQS